VLREIRIIGGLAVTDDLSPELRQLVGVGTSMVMVRIRRVICCLTLGIFGGEIRPRPPSQWLGGARLVHRQTLCHEVMRDRIGSGRLAPGAENRRMSK
jgi:hypothetical protein